MINKMKFTMKQQIITNLKKKNRMNNKQKRHLNKQKISENTLILTSLIVEKVDSIKIIYN